MLEMRKLIGASLLITSATFFVAGQKPASREYKIKAACLVNFATFVTWPAAAFSQPDSPLVIAVLGADPFGAALEQAIGADLIQGRPVVVKRFQRLEEVTPCHVLFIALSENDRLARTLKHRNVAGALTVGEAPQFATSGGMIRFTTKGEQVHFEINVDAMERARLKVSSKVLKLAIVIKQDEPEAPQ